VFANQPVDELAETTLSFAKKLLTLDRLRERDSLALRHRMRSALFDDLLSENGSPRELAERLAHYGLSPSSPLRLALLDPDDLAARVAPQGRANEEELEATKTLFVESVEVFLAHQGLPYLTLAKSDAVLALIQFRSADWAEAERTVSALRVRSESVLGVELTAAISAPFDSPGRTSAALREAREALLFGRKRGLRQVLSFDRIQPPGRLLVTQQPAELRSIVRQTLEGVLDYDERHRARLLTTLETFLAKDMSRSRTAAALSVHRNTLGKRLDRLETLLGVSLSRTDDVVALTLGLHAWDMLGRPGLSELRE
ncbi:MAG TPA: helix-turn-helix domain-containing protein, partial [Thermoleophilia bacterium]|nr:helix-turn-helix domain-containing protein [Thermoleophilia bacterium]